MPEIKDPLAEAMLEALRQDPDDGRDDPPGKARPRLTEEDMTVPTRTDTPVRLRRTDTEGMLGDEE